MRRKVVRELKDLGAFLWQGTDQGSQYIKFRDKRLGGLRIADHSGSHARRYRWNIRVDGHMGESDDGRRFYGPMDLDFFFGAIREEARRLGDVFK